LWDCCSGNSHRRPRQTLRRSRISLPGLK